MDSSSLQLNIFMFNFSIDSIYKGNSPLINDFVR